MAISSAFRNNLDQFIHGSLKTFFLQFAFPDSNNSPALFSQNLVIFQISFNISCDLRYPIILVRRGPYKSWAVMLMPKTPVYKYDSMILWEDNVWASGKFAYILSISKSLRKKVLSHFLLGLCVCASDVGHVAAPHFLSVVIRHIMPPNPECSSLIGLQVFLRWLLPLLEAQHFQPVGTVYPLNHRIQSCLGMSAVLPPHEH